MILTRLPLYFFVVAIGAALWRSLPPPAPQFAAPPPAPTPALRPATERPYSATLLPAAAASAHAATLVDLGDGRIACAWFAGSREGAADVAIWWAFWQDNRWSTPHILLDRAHLAADTKAHIRKLGNPVLAMRDGQLHLWVVSTGIGGWAASAINHLVSTDGGRNWSPARRLATSPFLNLSTLVRTPPLPLTDGGWGLPVYHELFAKHGEWLRLDAGGQPIDKVRLAQPVAALQPAVAHLSAHAALAVLRDAGPAPGSLRVSRTSDGGITWRTDEALAIPNPDSSAALIRLASGRLLLAANAGDNRQSLDLFLSDDRGTTWRKARTIENSPGAEFSYPALLQAVDGDIHLAYTWRRQAIRHVTFGESWLTGADR